MKLVPAVIVVTFGIAPTVPPTVFKLISTMLPIAAAVVVIVTFVVPLQTNVPHVVAGPVETVRPSWAANAGAKPSPIKFAAVAICILYGN